MPFLISKGSNWETKIQKNCIPPSLGTLTQWYLSIEGMEMLQEWESYRVIKYLLQRRKTGHVTSNYEWTFSDSGACYTLFVAVCGQQPNHFLTKKLSFGKHDRNTSTHYSSSTAIFANMNFIHILYCSKKKYFVFVKRLPTPVNAFC